MSLPLELAALIVLGTLWNGPALAAGAQDGSQDPGTAASTAQDDDGFRVFWSDGLRMETGDGQFQFRLGGRMMADWVFWGSSDPIEAVAGPLMDGTEFRRARLFVQGYMYEKVEFKAQYDFAGGEAAFKDVYFGTRGLPVDVRIGHFKEPFSIEELTSSKYITFMERSLLNVFVASRNLGVMVHGDAADERVGFGVGVFSESDDFGIMAGDNYNFTARVGAAPLYQDDGARVVHVGAAYTFKNVDEGSSLRFRQRPEVHIAPRFVDTGEMAADSASIVIGEAAVVYGPFSVQGELAVTSVDGLVVDLPLDPPDVAPVVDDPTFTGYYVEASYWLTGEHRAYELGGGEFDRISPRQNFLDGGLGAWQVAIRLSGLDLADGPVAGGELRDVTVGVNWHWNPMTRLMFNLVRADLDGVDEVTAFQTRAQIEF